MKIIMERDVPAEMRDGTKLFSDLYYPENCSPLPALLMRLPYDKSQGQDYVYPHPKRFAMHGYLVVVQDTRGRWKSEGDFYPFRNEVEDGYDTVEWVASLPQCDGNVGMYGFSYVGVLQLLAAAANPPHLRCISPAMVASQLFEGWTHNNGAFALAFNLSWALELAICEANRRGASDLMQKLCQASANIDKMFMRLPLEEINILKENDLAAYYFDWLNHSDFSEYWNEFNFEHYCNNIKIPILFIGGWYDVFCGGTITNFLASDNADKRKLIIGPWYHVPWIQEMGDVNFGPKARNTMGDLHLRWFNYWLKGEHFSFIEKPSTKIFVMGMNKWKEFESWPPKKVDKLRYYFHSKVGANSRFGDGYLDTERPAEERPDVYTYNPRNPVVSLGGNSCCCPKTTPMGPYDQSNNETQNQILIYSSKKLKKNLWVAGLIKVELFVSSSAPDTDFLVKLIDVNQDNQAINITEGIQRMSYLLRNTETKKMKPDEIYEINFDIGHTSYLFKKGHQIRVEITSSSFPQWDRNTNSGNKPCRDDYSDMVVAIQTVYHDKDHQSCIILPIIDRKL